MSLIKLLISHEQAFPLSIRYRFLFPFYAHSSPKCSDPILSLLFLNKRLFVTYQVQQARQEYQASSWILKRALEIHTPRHTLQHTLPSSHL